jgi:hypothetical protein
MTRGKIHDGKPTRAAPKFKRSFLAMSARNGNLLSLVDSTCIPDYNSDSNVNRSHCHATDW